jgi:hypothetical protein
MCQFAGCITSAVRAGFEPAVRFEGVRQFSKLLLSASQAPHRKRDGKNRWKNAIGKQLPGRF